MPTYTCALTSTPAGATYDLSVAYTTNFAYFENGANGNPAQTYGKYYGGSGQLYGYWAAANLYPGSGSGKNYSPDAYTSAEGFPAFNTSAIPPVETITSVSFNSYANNYGPSTTTAQLHGLGTTAYTGNNVAQSNWKIPSAFNNLCFTVTGSRSGALVTSTGTSAAVSYINKGGITYFALGDTKFINRSGYVGDDSGTIIPNTAATTLTVVTSPQFVHASDISATPTIVADTTGGKPTNFYTFNPSTVANQRPTGSVSFNTNSGTAYYMGNFGYVGMQFSPGGKNSSDSNTFYETFYSFDCSSIPTGWTISSATLNIKINGKLGTGPAVPMSFRKFDYGTTIEAADYRNSTQLAALTEYGSFSFPNGYSYITDYQKVTTTGTALVTDVSARGYVNMVAVTNEQFGGSAPGGSGDTYYYLGTGNGQYPTLFVTAYQTPSTTNRTADIVTIALSPVITSAGYKTMTTGAASTVSPTTGSTGYGTYNGNATSISVAPVTTNSGYRTAPVDSSLTIPPTTNGSVLRTAPASTSPITPAVSVIGDQTRSAFADASISNAAPSTSGTGLRAVTGDLTPTTITPSSTGAVLRSAFVDASLVISPASLASAIRTALAQIASSIAPSTIADGSKTVIQGADAVTVSVGTSTASSGYRTVSVGAATINVTPVTLSSIVRVVPVDTAASVNVATAGSDIKTSVASASTQVSPATNSSSSAIRNGQASVVIVTATGADGATLLYPQLYVWNGSGWVLGKLQYWTGSRWSNAVPKYWDGSKWVSSR
jgi:hypothetical protein